MRSITPIRQSGSAFEYAHIRMLGIVLGQCGQIGYLFGAGELAAMDGHGANRQGGAWKKARQTLTVFALDTTGSTDRKSVV